MRSPLILGEGNDSIVLGHPRINSGNDAIIKLYKNLDEDEMIRYHELNNILADKIFENHLNARTFYSGREYHKLRFDVLKLENNFITIDELLSIFKNEFEEDISKIIKKYGEPSVISVQKFIKGKTLDSLVDNTGFREVDINIIAHNGDLGINTIIDNKNIMITGSDKDYLIGTLTDSANYIKHIFDNR